MEDAALATLVGVETRVITSFRSGIPDWKLKKAHKKIAESIGINPDFLLSRIVKAERRIWSRWSNRFPSSDHEPYRRLTS
jgi:hypothetical protein